MHSTNEKSWRFNFTCPMLLLRSLKTHSRKPAEHIRRSARLHGREQREKFKFSNRCMHALKCKIAIGYYVWFLFSPAVIEFAFWLFTQRASSQILGEMWWCKKPPTTMQIARVREFTFFLFFLLLSFPPASLSPYVGFGILIWFSFSVS